MILEDSYKTYVIEEITDQEIAIKKNNDLHHYKILETINESFICK